MRCFFFDAVWPRVTIDEGTPRVTLPDDQYPGDREEWIEGYEAFADGFPLVDCNLAGRSSMELNSFIHGFMTARMAEAMAAEVPDELTDHGKDLAAMDGARLALDY